MLSPTHELSGLVELDLLTLLASELADQAGNVDDLNPPLDPGLLLPDQPTTKDWIEVAAFALRAAPSARRSPCR